MIHETLESPGCVPAEELLARYQAELSDTVQEVGLAETSDVTGLDYDLVKMIGAGESADITVEEAAKLCEVRDDAPPAETILTEIRNNLLLLMSTAMLNVDLVSGDLDLDLNGKEIQGKIEGRYPMTLEEYAFIHQYIARKAKR